MVEAFTLLIWPLATLNRYFTTPPRNPRLGVDAPIADYGAWL